MILASCRVVSLPLHLVLSNPESVPAYAFFLTSGLASLVTSLADGSTVEVGVLGREGIAGSLHLLGPCVISTECLMQSAGTGLTMPLPRLRELFERSPIIRAGLLEFVQSQAASLGQIAACHRLHLAEERLARWLLMVQDRLETTHLDLTQEFLANMLGSRRTTITKAAGMLEELGAIEFRRGRLTVLDRRKLIAAACVCYPVVYRLWDALYGGLGHESAEQAYTVRAAV
jgi:CRP-like cAMP-binding protein